MYMPNAPFLSLSGESFKHGSLPVNNKRYSVVVSSASLWFFHLICIFHNCSENEAFRHGRASLCTQCIYNKLARARQYITINSIYTNSGMWFLFWLCMANRRVSRKLLTRFRRKWSGICTQHRTMTTTARLHHLYRNHLIITFAPYQRVEQRDKIVYTPKHQ